ncbi:hypothetical protein EI94DRAFT_1709541 [Lactarius quietus]|nr:hypothetical protein EI94DRAFT_1709541 [Lactarius quietus]
MSPSDIAMLQRYAQVQDGVHELPRDVHEFVCRVTLLRSDPVQATKTQKQHKCLHEHWKNCYDYPEAHTWEARDQKDIEEEEAVRALVAAEDDSYLANDKACRVRQLVSNLITRGNTPDAGWKVITGRMRVT